VEARKRKDVVGAKIGKHVVKSGEIDVQLTDELSESLRVLQVRLIIGMLDDEY
jgi:hypothetical protein